MSRQAVKKAGRGKVQPFMGVGSGKTRTGIKKRAVRKTALFDYGFAC
jgi:hypothetical protein